MALSSARNRQKSKTPIPKVQTPEAPRFVRRLLGLSVRVEGLRLSPVSYTHLRAHETSAHL
eukprot:13665838-Alexandrium_andersonii.AAC.1